MRRSRRWDAFQQRRPTATDAGCFKYAPFDAAVQIRDPQHDLGEGLLGFCTRTLNQLPAEPSRILDEGDLRLSPLTGPGGLVMFAS